jgi:hypothetical protein
MVLSVLKAYLRPDSILQKYQAALPEEIRRFEGFSGEAQSLQAQAIALTDWLRFFYSGYGIPMILAAQFA